MNKSKSYAMASLAILTVALMFTASALPLALSAEEEKEETLPVLENGTVEAIQWWLRVLPVTSSFAGIYDYYDTTTNRFPVPAGSDDAVKSYARNIDAQRSAEQQYNLLMLASNLIENDTETWKLTNAYLNRSAEIAAGIDWEEGKSYDPDIILRMAGVYDAISTGNLNTSDVIDQGVDVSVNLKDKWNATNYGQSLDIKLNWDNGSTGNATNALYSDFCTLATANADEYVVYLSQSADTHASSTNSTIWAYTNAGSITSIDSGAVTELSKGANDASDLPSGFYKLSPGKYGGSFLNSTKAEACKTTGIMGIICDGQYGYASSTANGIEVFWNGAKTESNTLDYEITGSETAQTSNGSPLALVKAYSDYYNQLSRLLYDASLAGQVMWTISATSHESNILLSPSSIIPHLTDAGITAEQRYAMYVLALDQIAQYNTNYGDELSAGMTKISAQSLDTYCHGSIYAPDGTVIAENVIYTPYVYLRDWTIIAGDNATFSQDGLVMIWDTADTADGWTMPAKTTYESIIVEKGAYIMADEIYSKGEAVNSVHLEIDTIQRISAFESIDFGRDDAPSVLEASTLIMIIILELGLIIGLIGYIVRMPAVMAVGLIVMILGVVASNLLSTLILGLI